MTEKMRSQGARLTRGVVAARTGCHIETVRYYERIGLLPPPVPPENRVGPRIRGFSDRDWIPSLACTRSSFFSSFQHFATASMGA